VTNLLVRVWLPDRPGALGLVASRIGAIGGDIVGIDVLERSEHVAVDEFAVVLPGDAPGLVKLLIREIEEVDGASVEESREVERFPNPTVDALESVLAVCGAETTPDLFARLVARVQSEFVATWVVALRGGECIATAGEGAPPVEALEASAAGMSASPAVAAGDAGPDDLAVATLPRHDAILVVGRETHPFRRRERVQLLALARIADRVGELLA
jgi:hypothetical protein